MCLLLHQYHIVLIAVTIFAVVQSLSCVWLVARTAAYQASLSFTISQNLLRLTSIESVMPSNHLVLCHPFSSWLQSFPASGFFQMSQFFASGGQSIGVSASASVLPVKDWFPLGLTDWISLLSKGLSRVFFNTTVQKHQFFNTHPSLWPNSHAVGFPGGSAGKESAYNARDLGSVPGLGRCTGEGKGYPLQYSGLENSMDRGAWWATVHGVTKSQTRLSNFRKKKKKSGRGELRFRQKMK